MDRTLSRMVEVATVNGNAVTLDQWIEGSAKPLEYYGGLNNAISALIANKTGTIMIPPTETYKEVSYLSAHIDKSNEIVLNLLTFGTTAPAEGRPIIVDGSTNWIAGDIIFNTDISLYPYMGWKCMISGTPGTWKPFGDLSEQIEVPIYDDELPSASSVQVGKRVVLHINDDYIMYYCAPYTNDQNQLAYTWEPMKAEDVPITFSTSISNDSETHKWRINVIGSHTIEPTDADFTNKLPNTMLLIIRVPANSVNDQSILIGNAEYPITYINGESIKASNLVANAVVTLQVDLARGTATINALSMNALDAVTSFPTMVTLDSTAWKITSIGAHTISDNTSDFSSQFSSQYLSLMIVVPATSVEDQIIKIGARDYTLTYPNGNAIKAKEIASGAIVTVQVNLQGTTATICASGVNEDTDAMYKSKMTISNTQPENKSMIWIKPTEAVGSYVTTSNVFIGTTAPTDSSSTWIKIVDTTNNETNNN